MGGEAQVQHNPRHVTSKAFKRRERPERKNTAWIVAWKVFYTRNTFIAAPDGAAV